MNQKTADNTENTISNNLIQGNINLKQLISILKTRVTGHQYRHMIFRKDHDYNKHRLSIKPVLSH